MEVESKIEKSKEYPKAKYHPTHGCVCVDNAFEEKELGAGWYDTPGDFGVVTAPSQAQLRKVKLDEMNKVDELKESEVEQETEQSTKPRRR